MSELIREVTPLTRALIWIMPQELEPGHPHYQDVDYLLDGLLTATLSRAPKTNHILIGKSFGKELYVYCLNDLNGAEIKSYADLLQKEISGEEKILVVDDRNSSISLEKTMPKPLLSRIHFYK